MTEEETKKVLFTPTTFSQLEGTVNSLVSLHDQGVSL